MGHGGLRETHLSFGEREFSSALATARSRGGETRHGALADQIPLELGQGGEDSEHHATGRSRGVDLSALSSQNPQADLAVWRLLHRVDEMCKRSSASLELPDRQNSA